MNRASRALGAAILLATTALAGCGSRSTPPAGAPTRTSHPTSAAPSTPADTAAPRARNLVASERVKSQLVRAWARQQHLPQRDVVGTAPGSVYYGYLTSTHAYWAVASFTPSAHARTDGPSVMAQFQDGPWVFTRRATGSWRLVTDSGGQLCPGELPPPLAAVWALPTPAPCTATTPEPATTTERPGR